MFVLLASCKGGAEQHSDPPPSPRLSPEEARRLSEERSRQERELERGTLTPEEEENLPSSGPRPKVDDGAPRTTTRPLTGEEHKQVRDALSTCAETAATVSVMVEPGGLVFLAPGQRFPEADLACYARQLGAVRLSRDVARKGSVTLP
jgi:hypothetical protein